MSSKVLEIADVGAVTFRKIRNAKRMTIRLNHDGSVIVSMPFWVPYATGILFVNRKAQWIAANRKKPELLEPNQKVGKTHYLVFMQSQTGKIRTSISGNEARVFLPSTVLYSSVEAQKAAQRVCVRVLADQAKRAIPRRLQILASQFGYQYGDVTIRTLRGRWGSCTNKGDITINCYMIQLPWELIDYVLLHELAHTKVHSHSPEFWRQIESTLPNAKTLRREIKKYSPTVLIQR